MQKAIFNGLLRDDGYDVILSAQGRPAVEGLFRVCTSTALSVTFNYLIIKTLKQSVIDDRIEG